MFSAIFTKATVNLLMVTTAVSTIPISTNYTSDLVNDVAQTVMSEEVVEVAQVEREVGQIMRVPITAYSSTPDQTDDSPYVTANQTVVRDGVVAANFLPFGTRVRVPKLFGDKEFVVADRMNKRYYYKLDIWMPSRDEAKKFGLHITEIEILPIIKK